ncbi:MAG: AAA family ATPase [Deltaproteobacteria bacterium]|nr:AAA family ATPase [Deltaproteobacteria bacterium]
MAHLTYAMIQGDGFVEITGEVGTGKTTLCRAFLEDLDKNTKAAYIFNPKLNSIQLIKAINDEFGISSKADNTKDLIDTFNSFLIENKAKGKKILLIIDEAQNLTNEVMEQLRLLSNLETLLQIILVGQTELREKLNSHALRQLAQRITLSCQLIPLSYKEVRKYIQHRINIASRKPRIKLTRVAYWAIYRYSGGIPRLINIVCDRALLTAFGLDKHRITGNIVRSSIRELTSRSDDRRHSLFGKKKAILFLSVLIITLLMISFYRPGFLNVSAIFNSPESKKPDIYQPKILTIPAPANPAPDSPESKKPDIYQPENLTMPAFANPAPDSQESKKNDIPQSEHTKKMTPVNPAPDLKLTKPEPLVAPEPVKDPVRNLEKFLGKINRFSSRHMAFKVAMDLWNIESEIKSRFNGIDNDQSFFQLAAKQNGLLIRRIQGNFNTVKQLNLPAILELYFPGDLSPVYLTLSKIDYTKITLSGGERNVAIKSEQKDLESYWSGVAYIPWKNFLSLKGTIEIEISPFYDEQTQQAVREIQKKYGIQIDGIVGSTTKIALHNEKKILGIPHIMD